MRNLNFAFIAIPLFFSQLPFPPLHHNNECEKISSSTKPRIVLKCESNDGNVFTYTIPEEKIKMIADVAGYAQAQPIQFNIALPNSKVINSGDKKSAVVYIYILDNYEFASVEWGYVSWYTVDGSTRGDNAILEAVRIDSSPICKNVKKITIAKTGDESGIVTLNFNVDFKKSN